jgi:hypothetical protein
VQPCENGRHLAAGRGVAADLGRKVHAGRVACEVVATRCLGHGDCALL